MNLIRLDEFRLLLPKEGEMVTDAYIYANERIKIESEAIKQLYNTASLPPVKKALCTPDMHIGFGVPIGTVVGLETAVVPSAVGYDINCGMSMITTGLRFDEIIVDRLAHNIHNHIPLGEGKSNIAFKGEDLKTILRYGVRGLYEIISGKSFKKSYPELFKALEGLSYEYISERVEDRGGITTTIDSVPDKAFKRGYNQFATLGGGNHFIEIQRVISVNDSTIASRWGIFEDELTIMIHSGSRGFGHEIGDNYMRLAVTYDKRKNLSIPNNNLAYFYINDKDGVDYINAMNAAANFAYVNRHLMFLIIRKILINNYNKSRINLLYDIPHNIAKYETIGGARYLVHRKGATRAYPESMMKNTIFAETGQPILIPGSMGTRSYLLVGTEKAIETLFSVNHGAGRVMSRTAASGKGRRGKVSNSLISDAEFRNSMQNVYLICEDKSTIKEEAPAAYKNIDEVINVVTGAGIARVVAIMQPIAVLKG